MKFERTKDRAVETRDAECYRKFLAGNKTLYTQAFWENGPRRQTANANQKKGEKLLPEVEGSRN